VETLHGNMKMDISLRKMLQGKHENGYHWRNAAGGNMDIIGETLQAEI
jgi:hypothetical protein